MNELILVFYSYKKKHAVNQIQKQKRFVQEILLISKQAQLKMFFLSFLFEKKNKAISKGKIDEERRHYVIISQTTTAKRCNVNK